MAPDAPVEQPVPMFHADLDDSVGLDSSQHDIQHPGKKKKKKKKKVAQVMAREELP